jgi:ATP-dependent RNA helicase SUPV3L1/SUV3
MGLNLNIRRIIFNSVYKHDGQGIVRLNHSAVKQIAGRAGRRNSPYPEGLVTCRDPRDLQYIHQCLTEDVPPIEKAGLIPTASHLELFGKAMQEYHFGAAEVKDDDKNKPRLHSLLFGAAQDKDDDKNKPRLHSLLREFSDMAVVKGDYFLCRQQDMVIVAKWLDGVDLEIKDKFVFCMAPVNTDIPEQRDAMLKFGKKLAAGEVRDCYFRMFDLRSKQYVH